MSIKTKKGFTLIEVVIVLAIAALILIIVFLAVQGAQRSRRNEQRRADASRFVAAAESWAANHSGDYPANLADLNQVRDSLGTGTDNQFDDPTTGTRYTVAYGVAATGMDAAGEITGQRSAECVSGVLTNIAPAQNGRFAAGIYQEPDGSPQYCVSSASD